MKQKYKAAKILAEGLNMPEDFCLKAINNVRLCTYGDNLSFFGLNSSYKGVTGEEIYNKMEEKFRKTGYIDGNIQSWRTISNASLISSLSEMASMTGRNPKAKLHLSTVTEEIEKPLKLFPQNKSVLISLQAPIRLDENMKTIIDMQFLDIAKSFANSRIRIEGNTDNTGNRETNIMISKKRAEAVADYLITNINLTETVL